MNGSPITVLLKLHWFCEMYKKDFVLKNLDSHSFNDLP